MNEQDHLSPSFVKDHASPMPVLSQYIAGVMQLTLPAEVLEKAKFHFLDTVASMVSGSRMLAGQRGIEFIKFQNSQSRQASVLGTNYQGNAIDVAMVNGMFGHADETDDSHAASLTHPGCGIVAAVLAASELWNQDGLKALQAMVLGYDVSSRLTMSLDAYRFRARGYSSHSFGPNFGAAAAAGSLAGVNAKQASYLMSYAAQQASGIACWMRDKDHVEKAFDFGGMAARNGMSAAIMVSLGMTGVEDVFSGERNFYDAFGENPNPKVLTEGLGVRFEILQTSIKRWTVGSPIQAPLDSLDTLINQHGAQLKDLDAIHSIAVEIPEQSFTIVNNREMPEICLQHLIAVMLIDQSLTFEMAHNRERMQDPKVLEIRKRIILSSNDALSAAMPTRQGIVKIQMAGGKVYEFHTKDVKGTPNNPVNRIELTKKAMDLMSPVIGDENSQKACEVIWTLEQAKNLNELMRLLRA